RGTGEVDGIHVGSECGRVARFPWLNLRGVGLPSRHTLAPIGMLLVAVGVGGRLAFLSLTGAVFLVCGFALLGLAITRPHGRGASRDLAYPALFVVLAVVAVS